MAPGTSPSPPIRAPMQIQIEKVLDWFLHEDLHDDPEGARRARLVVGSALTVMALNLFVLMLVDWSPGIYFGPVLLPHPTVTALIFAILVAFSVAFTVKRSGKPETAALFLTVSLVLFFTLLAFFHGGYRSPVTWWLAAVPMFSAYLAGPRATFFTAIMIVVVLFLLYVVAPQHAMMSGVTWVDRSDDLLRAQVMLLGFITFFGWYYERARIEGSRDLMSAYSNLERTHSALNISQANVRQIAENIGQAIWMHDLHTDRVLYANASFEELFHLSRARLAANPRVWTARVHIDDTKQAPLVPDNADHTYRVVVGTEERWLRHVVYQVGSPDERTYRAIHIAADVTLTRTADALRSRYMETVLDVQENERRHLARELHDETGQSLTALLVGLGALANTLDHPDQADLAQQLREQLRMVVGDIGRLARGLHPSVLDELGLIAAVERLADDARAAHHIEVRLHVSGRELEDTLSGTVRLAAYRIVQESLTNIARHANATVADITVNVEPDTLHVGIEDNGDGFDTSIRGSTHAMGSGLGLVGLRERASLLGGRVRIESSPGMGTAVIGELPTQKTWGDEAPTSVGMDDDVA